MTIENMQLSPATLEEVKQTLLKACEGRDIRSGMWGCGPRTDGNGWEVINRGCCCPQGALLLSLSSGPVFSGDRLTASAHALGVHRDFAWGFVNGFDGIEYTAVHSEPYRQGLTMGREFRSLFVAKEKAYNAPL